MRCGHELHRILFCFVDGHGARRAAAQPSAARTMADALNGTRAGSPFVSRVLSEKTDSSGAKPYRSARLARTRKWKLREVEFRQCFARFEKPV